jgi:hypothetical protein
MIKLEIKVPTSIDDVTVGDYIKWAAANKEGADEEFLILKTVSIFCEVDIKEVSLMNVDLVSQLYEEIILVLNEEGEFKDRFTLNGVEYGFMPRLEDMTFGEFIDLEESLKDTKNLHKAAAVMYRPITKSFKDLYQIESYVGGIEAAEVMKDAPVGVISKAVVFFYLLGNALTKDFPDYLEV